MTQEATGYLRAKAAAAFLGIAISTFWRWSAAGVLPRPVRLSARASVWSLADLERFIESRKGVANEART